MSDGTEIATVAGLGCLWIILALVVNLVFWAGIFWLFTLFFGNPF